MPDTLVAPAFLSVPDHVVSGGAEAADLAGQIGLPLDPEQRLALDAMFAERSADKLAAFEFAIVAPRQNIKTHLLKAAAWADLILYGQQLVVWTAHEFNTAQEAFRDMVALVDGCSLLSQRVKRVVNGNGEEGIEFTSGQRLRFKARTKGGGRGLTGDVVILDEAFALQPAHMGSLLPTMAAKSVDGNPQVRYASSAGLIGSAVLRSVRDRGRPGGDPALAYVEWCAPEVECPNPHCTHMAGSPDCVYDDRSLWQAANLALGRRIDPEFVATMRNALPPEEFAREFLGWWDEPALGVDGLPLEAWQACADRQAGITEPCSLAFDVAPGHTSAAIVVAGGALHVTEHRYGTAWLPGRLLELLEQHDVRAVGFDPAGPAGALLHDLEKAGLTIRGPKTPRGQLVAVEGRESAQACEAFLAAAVGQTLVHRDESALNAAVSGAGRRQVGDSWKWSRRDSTVDISPLVAATLAHWLDDQLRSNANREWFGGWA